MQIERLHRGPRMSQIVRHGDTIYLAGQVGDPEAGIKQQTEQALDAVDTLLAEVGSHKSKALQVIVWLADIADFDAMNAVYDSWIDPEAPPVRACGESRLTAPGYRVEFIVTAAR